MNYANEIAAKLNAQLEKTDVQICNYARRFIVKKGSKMEVRGNCLYVNGKGEELQRQSRNLFCIAGYTSVGLMKAVAPDLSRLERIVR